MHIADKCYPSCEKSEDAFQQLLMDNVLPLASRRVIVDMSHFVHEPHVDALFAYYEEALAELFRFYATASDQKTKGRNMMKSTKSKTATFEEQKEEFIQAKARNLLLNSFANQMGYGDFLRFASDFGLTNRYVLFAVGLI